MNKYILSNLKTVNLKLFLKNEDIRFDIKFYKIFGERIL